MKRSPIEIKYAPPVRTVLVAGGAGFVGSAMCRLLASDGATRVINLDSMVDAADDEALAGLAQQPNYRFIEGDIGDRALVASVLAQERVSAVIHLAAETRVERGGAGVPSFLDTNIAGTFQLLEASLAHWRDLLPDARAAFRFHHVSSSAVFGDVSAEGQRIDETAPYAPASPIAAARAASDHLVRSWHQSFGLPVVLSHGGSCFGPFQKPGKLIPHAILSAIEGQRVPVYGAGSELHDWLHIDDYARALRAVLVGGQVGEHYLIGGRQAHSNLAVVAMICDLLDRIDPRGDGRKRRSLITFLPDRRAADRRHALTPEKIERNLGWRPEIGFVDGLVDTIDWYRDRERARVLESRRVSTGR